MSKHPGASQAVELLETLKATVRDFSTRATKLSEEYRLKVSRERHRRQTITDEEAKELTAQLSDADAAFEAAKTNRDANFEKRKVRIGKAYQASKEQQLKRIEDQTGGRKYDLQKKMLQSERDREAGLAAATSTLQEVKAELAAELGSLTELERTAQKCLKGYGKLLRLFQTAYEKADVDLSPEENRLLDNIRELLEKAGGEIQHLRNFFVLGIFRYWPLWLVVALGLIPAVPLLQQFGINRVSYRTAGTAAIAVFAVALMVRLLLRKLAEPMVIAMSRTLANVRRLHDGCLEKVEAHHQQEVQRVKDEFLSTTQWADQQLKKALADAAQQRVSCRMRNDEKKPVKISNGDSRRLSRVNGESLKKSGPANCSPYMRRSNPRTRRRKSFFRPGRPPPGKSGRLHHSSSPQPNSLS